MSDVMRSYSVRVSMTPRQALAALRGLEHAALTTEAPRTWSAYMRIQFALQDAGWIYDDLAESWTLRGQPAMEDRA